METIKALEIVQKLLTEDMAHCNLMDKIYGNSPNSNDGMTEYLNHLKENTEALSIVFDLANRTVYG